MSRRTRWSLIAVLLTLTFGLAGVAHAESTGSVTVSLQVETLSIAITGGTIDFEGPWGPNEALHAHPQESEGEVPPPTITNNGNVPITSVVVAYTGAPGEEATCDGGEGSWAAHANTTGTDQFFMRAWASTSVAYSNFIDAAFAIDPTTGSGNVLAAGDSPLEADGELDLLLELVTPNPPLAGSTGCSIGLSVTASAS